ncbi:glycerophosphodiester phosphodiesterase family protein [Neisseria wadsworthii]|uniref:glycerophosphodiester phosphodiesterase family protein n=1 Tax=Neisseria wadsworthii TaxID=607711 RepID=UPI000D30738D|nr:glycerophosphodiester phosphodiesterase family protein [Neisseria wadsworthii]
MELTLFFAGPLVLRSLTVFFWQHDEKPRGLPPLPPAQIPALARIPRLFAAGVLGVLLFNAALSAFTAHFFQELFRSQRPIAVVAHRGGGNLGAENTLAGLEAAIAAGAAWSEIDVQRTSDGGYVINHDKDFARLSGSGKTSAEMTLAEARALPVKDLFDSSRANGKVATLEEFMDAAKGSIGLFIELKGATADTQMVDDVARLIKAKGMEREAAILSLDYKLIQYSEAKYPELDSGFLYFFTFGNPATLTGDYLIMEEGEATPANIEAIRAAGKRVVVWTVNTDESIARFTAADVDGVITDYPVKVKNAIAERKNLSDRQLILEKLLE